MSSVLEKISRKGAKAQSESNHSSLRLCAFAGDLFANSAAYPLMAAAMINALPRITEPITIARATF